MVKREDTIEVLQKAKDLVVAGWCQGELWNEQSQYCVVGAIDSIHMSMSATRWPHRAYQTRLVAMGFLYDALPPSAKKKRRRSTCSALNEEHTLMDWNDKHGRRQSDVIDLYDRGLYLAKTAGHPED